MPSAMTEPESKKTAPAPEPAPVERPKVNYENPAPLQPIRPSPMWPREGW
jgi:hypothetical protein